MKAPLVEGNLTTMSKYQPNPRHSLARGAAAARALNATRVPSPRIFAETVEVQGCERDVFIKSDDSFGTLFMVRSSVIPTRYYPIVLKGGAYQCRVSDQDTANVLIARAKAYVRELAAA